MKWTSLILLTLSFCGSAQYLKPGKWRGVIHYSQQDVPFSFEVSYPDGSLPTFTFINGKERREISEVRWENDSIRIPLPPFDVEIRASVTATSMQGSYEKFYRGTKFGFSAEYGLPRLMKKSIRPSPPVEKQWDVTFEEGTPNESKGVGLFEQVGERVFGTIMTTTSDYRYFEGIMDGDSIKLSSFDGAHAFMILGKKIDEQWEGLFVFDEGYSEKWIAVADAEAEIEDPFELVKLENGIHKPFFDLLAAGSGKGTIDPSNYQGKVLIIQVFGTWCPNSHDETKYLVDWYNKEKPENVELLASSFEANYSQEYGLRRIEEYKAANKIPYEVVLGGRLSKTAAAMPFPFIRRIEAFPTLVFVDKQGYARYVHSYFNGPATGPYYDAFDKRFNEIIDELVAE